MSLAHVLDRFAGRRVAVVGDVMLDHFIVGHVDRISPEAPVPVVRFGRDEYRLGGAGNVARNIAALDGQARLVGLVGDDAAAGRLRHEMTAAGLDDGAFVIDRGRPTTCKVRIVTTRNQQVARVDYETDAEASGDALARLVAAAQESAAQSDAIVLSDYRKGVISGDVIAAAVANRGNAPLLIDPKVPQVDRYRGATLLTPNHHEAELMTQTSIRSAADASHAARLLHDRTGANILITWGEHGMFVFDASGGRTIEESLSASAREVADVTGAGDTVIAVLALGLAAGAPLLDAARLANLAAGLVVAKFGPASASRPELQAAAGVSGR